MPACSAVAVVQLAGRQAGGQAKRIAGPGTTGAVRCGKGRGEGEVEKICPSWKAKEGGGESRVGGNL